MVKGVIFDLDETLCNSETNAHNEGLKALFHSYSEEFPMSEAEFDKLFNDARAEIKREHKGLAASHERLFYIQRMIEKTHKTVIPELILKHYHAYWDTLIDNLEPIPEAKEVLIALKKLNIKTAIVSNLTSYVQMRKIVKLGISNEIDYLVTSQEAASEKPHPGIFLYALNKMNLLPQEVIMIGDSLDTDIDGANATNIKSIWLNRQREKDKKYIDIILPTATITKLSEIFNHLI